MAGTYRYQHGDKPLEGYTILRGIGRGGFGEVYYSVSDGGREVALKAIQQNHDIELRGVGHCINLKSPHLISIFDVKKNADGVPFVIMEYIAGPSLRALLPRDGRGLGLEKASFLLREIAKGLNYLHDRGIVHRDLKPENIFLEDGFVKIGDYGLSKYISVSRQSGQTISVGTVHYMAPEIGSGNYHQGIDVYSLGIIFYELLTGNVPFNGDSMGEILMKHLTCEPDVSMLEPALRPIVKKALAKNPLERYRNAREMVDEVLAIEGLAARVGTVDPQSLTGSARSDAGAPVIHVASPTAETTPVAPALAAATWTRDATPTPSRETPAAAAARGGARGFPIAARFVPGLATAGAVSLALGLFNNGRINTAFGYFALLAALGFSILWVEQWFVPRFGVHTDIFRRLVTLGLVGPLALLVFGPLSSSFGLGGVLGQSSLLAFVAGLVCVDWGARTRLHRAEHISVGFAVSAAIFGAVAGALSGGRAMAALAAFFAALSLVLNALSPFAPRSERGARRKDAGEAPWAPAPVAAASPGPPPLPAAASRPAVTAVAAAPQAPAPLATAATTRRMLRPRRDRVFAGVCSGIANYFGWEPALVRVIFALVAVAFAPVLLAYFVLWLSMPNEPLPPPVAVAVPAVAAPRRRSLMIPIIVVLLIAAGVVATYFTVTEVRVNGPGRAPVPPSASTMAVRLVPLAILGAAFTATIVFAIVRRARGKVAGAGSGWSALGTVLIVVAAVAAAADVHFKLRMTEQYFGNAVSRERLGPAIHDFLEDGGLAKTALVAFSAGALFVVLGRVRRGGWHVVRGLTACAALGLLAGFPMAHAREMREIAPAPQEVLGWCLLLVATLIVLTWPARSASVVAPPAVSEPREQAA